MTSASGLILAKGVVEGRDGVRAVTRMLAVEVGERCRVRGCGDVVKVGLGSARIWERRLSSRKVACSSMTEDRRRRD